MNFNVFFGYKKRKTIFNNINFEIKENKITVICGHNGAGKTTLLKLVSGILPSCIDTPTGWYVSASGGLIQHFSLLEHLDMLGKNLKENELVKYAYELFEAEKFEKEKVRYLSTGQIMMASIILAIASTQNLLLLDEPFASLDPIHAEKLSDLLKKITMTGRTIVITSHDLYLSAETADVVYFIKDGNISWNSSTENFEKFSVEELKEKYIEYA